MLQLVLCCFIFWCVCGLFFLNTALDRIAFQHVREPTCFISRNSLYSKWQLHSKDSFTVIVGQLVMWKINNSNLKKKSLVCNSHLCFLNVMKCIVMGATGYFSVSYGLWTTTSVDVIKCQSKINVFMNKMMNKNTRNRLKVRAQSTSFLSFWFLLYPIFCYGLILQLICSSSSLIHSSGSKHDCKLVVSNTNKCFCRFSQPHPHTHMHGLDFRKQSFITHICT